MQCSLPCWRMLVCCASVTLIAPCAYPHLQVHAACLQAALGQSLSPTAGRQQPSQKDSKLADSMLWCIDNSAATFLVGSTEHHGEPAGGSLHMPCLPDTLCRQPGTIHLRWLPGWAFLLRVAAFDLLQ